MIFDGPFEELVDLTFGHPWHGLWRAADGKILTPGGQLVATPGQAPSSYGTSHRAGGDCYRLAVPGQAAVETTPAEVAEGKTWLNYALMSGQSRRLYGKILGALSWLYVAPDSTVWKASLTFTGARAGTVLLKRFGVIGGSAPAQTQTLNFSMPSADVGGADRMIEDIWTDGSKVLVACCDYLSDPDYYGEMRFLKGVMRLTLGGVPPAATLAATVEVTYTEADPPITQTASTSWHKAVWDDTGGVSTLASMTIVASMPDFTDLPPFHSGMAVLASMNGLTRISEPVIGACFDAAGAVLRATVRVQIDVNLTISATARDSMHVIDIGGSGTAQTTIAFKLAGQSKTYTIDSTMTIVGDTPTSDLYDVQFTHVYGSKTGTATISHGGVGFGWPMPMLSDVASPVTGAGIFCWIGPTGGQTTWLVWDYKRYSNGLFGIDESAYGVGTATLATPWKHSDLLSISGKTARDTSSAAQFDAYASRHPATGEVAFSSSPICWV